MTPISHLQCVTCQRQFSPSEIDYTCPDCGPLHGTLDVIYHYDQIHLTRESLATNREPGHWRYLPILPIARLELIPNLLVGGSPLYQSAKLAHALNLRSVWIKDDGRNPTASYKDRASSVAVVKALEKNCHTVTAASTGNAASSWSAFTALAGLATIIFVPENAPRAKVTQLLLYGARVLKVRGTYDDAFDLCCRAAESRGWYNRSTAINPYLGEGKKTGALEICEQLDWQVPDMVFVSVGDGCIIQGLWKGFRDFYELGLIERLPRLIGVQAEGSAPLVHAFEHGLAQAEPLVPHTIADSISVGVPRDQIKALRAVRESNGKFIAVPDQGILAAISTLAREVGVLAEPAGAAAMAGLQQMVKRNELSSDATAVVMVTGHGLKDIDGVMKAVQRQPQVIDNSLDSLELALKK